jgi:hypothetical protein
MPAPCSWFECFKPLITLIHATCEHFLRCFQTLLKRMPTPYVHSNSFSPVPTRMPTPRIYLLLLQGRGERTRCASTASSLNLCRANAQRPLTNIPYCFRPYPALISPHVSTLIASKKSSQLCLVHLPRCHCLKPMLTRVKVIAAGHMSKHSYPKT